MKNFLLLFSFVSFLSIVIPVHAQGAGASPFPSYDAYSQKPVTRGEIEQMLDSPEFKELTEQLMPGMKLDMSPEERQAIIDDTMRFAEKMESLPPEEQQKELEAMFKQLPPPPARAARDCA